MEAAAMPWLSGMVGTVTSIAVGLLFVVNGLFAAGLLLGRDRSFVDRWTKPLVVTDAALLLAVIGVPVAGIAIKLGGKGLVYLATIPGKLLPGK